MNRTEIRQLLESLQLDLDSISDSATRARVVVLLNLVETLVSETERLREEQQQLRDEINRLKGEQGQPEIKGKTPKKKPPAEDISSEPERRNLSRSDEPKSSEGEETAPRPSKRERLRIDRVELCPLDRSELPADAQFKGYESVVIQDLKIITDNVEYRREVYSSASQKKTYRGALPPGIQGNLAPGVKALILTLKHVCNISQPKLFEWWQTFQIELSRGTLSNLLTDPQSVFHQEKEELYRAALECGRYQQIDDTAARVNGQNHHTQVMCNPLYPVYFTTARQDRLSVLDVLRNFAPRRFLLNEEALELLQQFPVSQKLLAQIEPLKHDNVLNEALFNAHLAKLVLGPQQHTRVLEAAAIAAYHQQTDWPIVGQRVCDEAPQFKKLTETLALCWIHDGRHYKKLQPFIPRHQDQLKTFRHQYWPFYGQLLAYKRHPSAPEADRLSAAFDRLFTTRTEDHDLDERIAKSFAKKDALLAVLHDPELPLHNNESELGARVQARVRDVSLHTKSSAGTRAKDTFMSVVQTAKKHGVNVYDYLYDRLSGTFAMPSLAQLIREKSKVLWPTCPDPP